MYKLYFMAKLHCLFIYHSKTIHLATYINSKYVVKHWAIQLMIILISYTMNWGNYLF